MPLSNYSLDKYVAHKLSELTECGAPELSANPDWIGAFVLNTIFIHGPNAYSFNFLRRVEGAFSAYRVARSALMEYLGTTPRNVSPYFMALLNFEVCIAQCYQSYEMIRKVLGKDAFRRNDESDGDRLWKLYTVSKHMEDYISKPPADATAAIWITNTGLESKQATLTFDELFKILRSMGQFADQVSTSGKGPSQPEQLNQS